MGFTGSMSIDVIQLRPALMDSPPTEFRLEQMQVHSPFIEIPFIPFVGNKLLL